MRLGVLMLVHTAFDRVREVTRHWTKAGCPVVLHVDTSVDRKTFQALRQDFKDDPLVRFSKRHRCEWGMWGLVAASQSAAETMLEAFPEVRHVFLSSGSCLPLRPVEELEAYLGARPDTDFIESATTADVPWTVGGLETERFTLRFPFSWRRNRYVFDKYVELQRRLKVKRTIPNGLVPHMGSQWWCLTRDTLSAILRDPERATFERYFKRVWIPDESYFQSLARLHSNRIESRSLTLSKFDFQGKPHIFYDDHLQLLRRSDCFVARKIWPHANRLYDAFLKDQNTDQELREVEPNPAKIDRIFSKAVDRRTLGRPGLYMQSRFVHHSWENGVTSGPYSVFQGFTELFEDFETWLTKASGCKIHGHIFAPKGAEFAGGVQMINGALTSSAALRDYNPRSFLTNFIWNTRGERQCFQYGPADNQANNWLMAKDPNAQISVISGAWSVPLFRSEKSFEELRREAAKLQKIEADFLEVLRSPWAKAKIRIWTMAEFIEAPMEPLQTIVDEIGSFSPRRLTEAPKLTKLDGFGQFLQNLKNEGMHPYLMGDFPVSQQVSPADAQVRKPYLVQ